MPYFVATKMAKIRKPTLFAPSPNTYAKAALGSVGVAKITHGYWAHSLQVSSNSELFSFENPNSLVFLAEPKDVQEKQMFTANSYSLSVYFIILQ